MPAFDQEEGFEMGYITNQDIEERLGTQLYIQLTDDTGSGVEDEDKVTEARLAAEGEVDSYVGRRYCVPVETVSQAEVLNILKSVTLDLATFRLYLRKPPMAKEVEAQHEAVLAWLKDVAEGRAVLPATAELPEAVAGGVRAQACGSKRALSRRLMKDF